MARSFPRISLYLFASLTINTEMITERGLTAICNGLGALAMLLIFAYHFVAVNGKKMEESTSRPRSG